MPLRDVKPLNEEQWKQVTRMMKSGPTDESIAVVTRALENARKIRRE